MMKLSISLLTLVVLPQWGSALEYSGRANTWSLYETDDTSSTTIALIRDETGTTIGIAVGRDIDVECAKPNRTCEFQKIGTGDLERVTGNITNPSREIQGAVGKDTLLWNLGLDAKATHKNVSGKIHGDFRASLLENRQNYGNDKYRIRLTDLYGEYSRNQYVFRAGRQAITSGGLLLDGASAAYQFGPEHSQDSKWIGVFAGLSADPISKNFSAKFMSLGAHYRFIPNFSANSETKLNIEGALIAETYEGAMNRFYLSTKLQFTPIRKYSLVVYSNLELPWSGEDGSIKSSMLTFQNYWRPAKEWFFSFGLSQFRMDRFLQKEAIQWVTENSAQQARVGDSLDRSHRYRLDFRASYRPFSAAHPYVRFRYERRTFDDDKKFNNSETSEQDLDFSLLNRKNAYQGTFGIKLNLIDNLTTDSSGSYMQRFQSRGYVIVQEVNWDPDLKWSAGAYGQWINSERTRDSSISGGSGIQEKSNDIYIGLSGSYRIRNDLKAYLSYEYGNESDQGLGRRTTIQTVYLRLDHSF
jgi:hypothetical protein